ncbi:MAG TPA: cytochrome c-type biogenesis protein CcmH [Candidatus Acidoferrum sp.]|nr:cytochrome c-type biogenesis protein CcmH [Candidatus Acidoferrum sp.]
MTKTKKILTYLFVASLGLAPIATLNVRAELDHAHELGKQVRCSCGGCEQSAGTCYHVGGAFSGPCEMAKTMIKEIQGHLDKGLTDDQVIQAMIKEYGTAAYVEPPKEGFGLVAWLMPGVYLLAGAGLVLFVISRWRKRGVASEAVIAKQSPVSPEVLARAKALAQKAMEE